MFVDEINPKSLGLCTWCSPSLISDYCWALMALSLAAMESYAVFICASNAYSSTLYSTGCLGALLKPLANLMDGLTNLF